jgi:hypothetical protein
MITTSVKNTVAEIKKTNDYSMFKTLEGNRNLNKVHLERLKKSMEVQYLLCPIIVNNKYEIIDGQHRYQAAKDLKLPVYYFVVKNYGLPEVQRFNSNQKNFGYDDFLQGYCDLGYDDYIILHEFKSKYNLDWNSSFLLLTGRSGSHVGDEFKNGNFKIKDLKKADLLASRLTDFGKYYKGFLRRSFVQAFYQMVNTKNYDHLQMLNKLRYMAEEMRDCTNKDAYISMLERIYNYRTRGECIKFAA